jgi:UDP-GlcNAc:undecaprenyl-phosphate GlcNAc-1-phosphate transferase
VTGIWDLGRYFVSTFALSLVLVPVCRGAARRLGKVAHPTADRWHRKPTALLGGIAIALSALAAAAFIHPANHVLIYAGVGAAIFAVGLTDDLMPLKPSTKLVAQLALASVFVFFGYRLQWAQSLTLDALLSVLWIVGITNALNLLDNMDGLCAGIAIVVGLSILVSLAPVPEARPEALYLAAVLGAAAGFLVYNVHPASIFMGDSGSLFLGMTLAGMSLELPRHSRDYNVLAVFSGPLLVMLIPIFDTTLVTAMRLLSGRSPAQGGRDHSSHRLVAIGLPEKQAVMVLWVLAAAGGVTAWALRQISLGSGVLTVGMFAVSMLLFAIFLTRVRVYEGHDLRFIKSGGVTAVVVNFMHKRRVAEVLLDFLLITVAYYSAYHLRFEGGELTTYFPLFLESLPVVLAVQLPTLFLMGVYRGVWRHFGLIDGVVMAKAVGLGTVLIELAVLYLFRFANYSRAVFVIYAMVLMLLFTGSRASFRLMAEFVHRRRQGDRLVIYGAGGGSALVLQEIMGGARAPVRVLGLIDDDPNTHRTRVHGYPVLGGYESLVALITGGAVDQLVISTRLIDSGRLADLESLCSENSVRVFHLRVQLEPVAAVS